MRDPHRFNVYLSIEARPELDEDVKVLLFESVREWLLNAVNHAKVTEARIHLARVGEDRLRVVISDGGPVSIPPGRNRPMKTAADSDDSASASGSG